MTPGRGALRGFFLEESWEGRTLVSPGRAEVLLRPPSPTGGGQQSALLISSRSGSAQQSELRMIWKQNLRTVRNLEGECKDA